MAQETLTYVCDQCGYENFWTRAEVLQRGTIELYRDGDLQRFTLPCKNPRLACNGRRLVSVSGGKD